MGQNTRCIIARALCVAGLSLPLLGFSACLFGDAPKRLPQAIKDYELFDGSFYGAGELPVAPQAMESITEDHAPDGLPSGRVGAKPYLDCIHYDETGFMRAVEYAAPYRIEGEMLAATSPHFLPAMSFTANILSTLMQEGQKGHEMQKGQGQPSLTIFLVAANHSGEGLPLIVADRGWSTPFGNLEFDEEATTAILNSPYLADKIDIDLFHLQNDHSAATLTPFIKYYLPQAQVVTILLGRDCPLGQLQALADIIYEISRLKPVFVLASVDFSHFLHIEETAKRDEITDALIQAGDIQAIKYLDDGNMDSPESIITLINYAALYPDAQVERRDHIILPESETKKDIGYSYNTYIFFIN